MTLHYAFLTDNVRANLVVLLAGDGHQFEDRVGSKDGATDPRAVLRRWVENIDRHIPRRKAIDLLMETLWKALEHGGTARKEDVHVHILPDIARALLDGLEQGLVDTVELEAGEVRFEEELWAAEPRIGDRDVLAIWEFVIPLHTVGIRLSVLQLAVEVIGDVAELLLDVTDIFPLSEFEVCVPELVHVGGGVTDPEELHEVLSEFTAAEGEAVDGLLDGVALVDRDCVDATLTNI